MNGILFLLSILTFITFILGLIKPSMVIRWSDSPSRMKATGFFLIPSVILFFLFGATYESAMKVALKDPLNTTELTLRGDKLTELPEGFSQLKNLTSLDLSNNNLTRVPEEIRKLTGLTTLDLTGNPISELPDWLVTMPNLYSITINRTKVSALPFVVEGKDLSFEYFTTPLWDIENPPLVTESSKSEDKEEVKNNNTEKKESGEVESIGEYAFRTILFGDEYGSKVKFGKSEIFFESPVTKEEVDGVGKIMKTLGLISDDKAISLLLNKDADENDVPYYILKMVVTDAKNLDDELITFFQGLRLAISESALNNQNLEIHLTDNDFDTQRVLK